MVLCTINVKMIRCDGCWTKSKDNETWALGAMPFYEALICLQEAQIRGIIRYSNDFRGKFTNQISQNEAFSFLPAQSWPLLLYRILRGHPELSPFHHSSHTGLLHQHPEKQPTASLLLPSIPTAHLWWKKHVGVAYTCMACLSLGVFKPEMEHFSSVFRQKSNLNSSVALPLTWQQAFI